MALALGAVPLCFRGERVGVGVWVSVCVCVRVCVYRFLGPMLRKNAPSGLTAELRYLWVHPRSAVHRMGPTHGSELHVMGRGRGRVGRDPCGAGVGRGPRGALFKTVECGRARAWVCG